MLYMNKSIGKLNSYRKVKL